MKRPTLRRRLYLLLVQWLVLFLLLAAAIFSISFARFRANVLEDRLLLARTIAHYLDSTVSSSFNSLRRLPAELPSLDEEAIGRLRSFRFGSLFRDAIYILDGEGKMLVADPPFVTPLPADSAPRHEQVTSLFSKRGEPDRPTLAALQPFERGGRSYTLVAEMNPRGSPISTFLQSLAAEPELHVVVVDSNGAVIAAPDHKQLFRVLPEAADLGDRITSHRAYTAEGAGCSLCDPEAGRDRFLLVMVPLRFAPWGVVVEQHGGKAFAALYSSQYGYAAAAGLLVVMGLLLSRGLSHSVVEPIRDLSRQAELLRGGDLDRRISVRGDFEIEFLASTLNEARARLAATLQELRRLNEGLEEQVAARTRVLHEESERRKALVQRLLSAGEEERRRIARELHDEISQLLTVIQLSLEGVGSRGPELEKAMKLLDEAQHEVHRIIYDLRPSLLDDLGLPAAVGWYADNYLAQRGIQVSLEVEDGLRLPPEIEIVTFRIYQEIVTNILRHSRAETVSIELYREDGRLVLAVEDDGVGFRTEERSGGAGILGMGERAELVGGHLTVDSEPGMGTHVQLAIPILGGEEADR